MPDPSPICEVKEGAGAFVSTTGGVDVSPGSDVTIRLKSQSDVDSWSIECVTTDDTSDAGTVTASLTIDALAKTALFSAPSAGKAFRFRSRVNSGVDRNGVVRPSYEATFTIYSRINGRRPLTSDETTEGDATFGWIKWHNDILRSLPSGVASGTWTSFGGSGNPVGQNFQVQYYSSGVFAGASGIEYDTTLNRPILHAPVFRGTAVFTGTDIVAHGLSGDRVISVRRKATTTNANVIPAFAWRLLDDSVSSVAVEVNAVPTGAVAGGSYARRVMLRMRSGVGTSGALESSWNDEHTASGVGFTGIAVGSAIWIGVSGATGFVNIKGTATSVIKWGVSVTVQETAASS
jgi:hypothetical protein